MVHNDRLLFLLHTTYFKIIGMILWCNDLIKMPLRSIKQLFKLEKETFSGKEGTLTSRYSIHPKSKAILCTQQVVSMDLETTRIMLHNEKMEECFFSQVIQWGM